VSDGAADRPPRLGPVAYIVLGLLAEREEATPYELKGIAADGVGNFWTIHHAQLYAEPERLAAAGLVRERREQGGRRRRHYAITDAGRRALAEWVAGPVGDEGELRDPGLLKLFFGADPATVAPGQLGLHEQRLRDYEALEGRLAAAAARNPRYRGPLLTLRAGLAHQRVWVEFWDELAGAG
jgi:DNA-binding PadR family transcriptional regulator